MNATIDDTDNRVTVTIVEDPDDRPTVSLSGSDMGYEGATLTFTATLSSGSGRSVTVAYGASDGSATSAEQDYTVVGSALEIPAGQTTADFTVMLGDDALDEDAETFVVQLLQAER